IKGESLNFSVPAILNLEDDDDDDEDPGEPTGYPDSIFVCNPGIFSVKVAFTDTGFDGFPTGASDAWQPHHPEFVGRIWQNAGEANGSLFLDDDQNGVMDDATGWDFVQSDLLPLDENAHGTHVAGIAAGKFDFNEDNLLNKLMILKTHNPIGEASMWQLVQALDYALLHDAKIVNMSLAYLSPVGSGAQPSVMEYLIEFAKVHRGTLFVAAAGNDALDLDQPLQLADGTPVKYCPANLPNDNLIVAAAGTTANELAPFSNFGSTSVDLAAPGVDIYSAILSGNYGNFTGTSMAAPHVSAAAALAGSQSANFNWKKIKSDILTKSTLSPALSEVTTSGRMLAFCGEYSGGGDPLLVSVRASQILCTGGSTTLSATPSGGVAPYNFSWSNGSSGSQTTVNTAGNFTVTVTDGTGATATETVKIFASSAPLADVLVDTIFCNETSATLTIQNAVAGADYLWSNGSTASAITVSPAQTTVFSVTTTLPTGCSSVSQITLPVLRVTVGLSPQTIFGGECAWLEPAVSGGGAPFQFHWNTGESYPAVEKCPAATEIYSVTVTSNESCTGTASVEVTVLPPGSNLIVPPAANYLPATTATALPSAVAECESCLENETLRVFPNPVIDVLQIEGNASQTESQAEIFTTLGTLAHRFSLPAGGERQEVFVGNLPPGFYFLKIERERQALYFVKK
ncbi:MAG: S8 family serine peptidase, partial [Bacteroidota bacterium]